MMGSGPVDGDGNEGNGNDNSVSEGGDPVFGNFFDGGDTEEPESEETEKMKITNNEKQ